MLMHYDCILVCGVPLMLIIFGSECASLHLRYRTTAVHSKYPGFREISSSILNNVGVPLMLIIFGSERASLHSRYRATAVHSKYRGFRDILPAILNKVVCSAKLNSKSFIANAILKLSAYLLVAIVIKNCRCRIYTGLALHKIRY